MLCPAPNGPEVVSVFTSETSAEAEAMPLLPLLSVLFPILGSVSAGVGVGVLSNAPAALMVAVTVIVFFAMIGRPARAPVFPAPPLFLSLVMVRLVGVSVTWMLVAVDGPALDTKRV